jgi:hypothetical protein
MRLRCGLVLLLLTGWTLPARAGLITFDSAADVDVGAGTADGVWNTDRYAPAFFEGGFTRGGRTGVLLHSISAADQLGSRPAGFNSPFYNTQGRKLNLDPGTVALFIDLYVPSTWDSILQDPAPPGSSGRFAGLWATAVDASSAVSIYPIIEFNNQTDASSANGFRIYNAGVWENVGGFAGFDQWYRIGFVLSGGNVEYFVNEVSVGSFSAGASASLANVILQGYNLGNSYDIHWDNLNSSNIAAPDGLTLITPEPGTLTMFSMLIAGLGAGVWRRRRQHRQARV